MRRQMVALAVAFLLSLSGRSAWGQVQYKVTDLGTLGGSTSQAYGINASGQVVGDATTSSGVTHAFLYSSTDGITDLDTLGGTSSHARGINDAGNVVGFSQIAGDGATHAFLYNGANDPKMSDLGHLSGNNSYAYAINNAQPFQIVGWADMAGPPGDGSGNGSGFSVTTHAASFSSLGPSDFGTLLGGTSSCAYGINLQGNVVGFSQTSSGADHAFLYYGSTKQTKDLGALLGSTSSCAYGINDASNVVGYTHTSSGDHAFLYRDDSNSVTDLATLGGANSYAFAINNNDQVVGSSDLDGGGQHAFIDEDNTMHDLNDMLIDTNSGWTLEEASAINELGANRRLG